MNTYKDLVSNDDDDAFVKKKALTNLIGGVTWVIAPFTPGDASNLSDFLFSTR